MCPFVVQSPPKASRGFSRGWALAAPDCEFSHPQGRFWNRQSDGPAPLDPKAKAVPQFKISQFFFPYWVVVDSLFSFALHKKSS